MPRSFWRIGRIGLGGTCMALGVVGLFVPFLQGILLLVVGLSLLSTESEWARHYHERLRRWVGRDRVSLEKRGADGE